MFILTRCANEGLQIGPDCTLMVGEVQCPIIGPSRVWIHGVAQGSPFHFWCTNHKTIVIKGGIDVVTFNHKTDTITIGVKANMRIVRLEALGSDNPFDPHWTP